MFTIKTKGFEETGENLDSVLRQLAFKIAENESNQYDIERAYYQADNFEIHFAGEDLGNIQEQLEDDYHHWLKEFEDKDDDKLFDYKVFTGEIRSM